MQAKVVVRMTRSQQFALAGIIIDHARNKDSVQEWVDIIDDTTTTTGELLTLILQGREIEMEGPCHLEASASSQPAN